MSPEEARTRDAVDSEPKHYQLSYSGPKSSLDFLISLQTQGLQSPVCSAGSMVSGGATHSSRPVDLALLLAPPAD